MGTTRKYKKASKGSGAKAGIGIHGEDAVELMFRIGGGQVEQLARLMELEYRVMKYTLSRLEAHRYVATTHDYARYQEKKKLTGEKERGRPPEYYYLTPRGVTFGGALAGAEDNDESRAAYKRYNLPALSTHNSVENSVLLSILDASANDLRWDVPRSEIVCESGLDSPYLTAKKDKGSNKLRGVEPDGEFVATTPHGRCIYMLEVESELRAKNLVSKIDDYASWMRAAELVRPVLFVGLTSRQASSMRSAAKSALESSAGEWRKWADLFSRKAKGQEAEKRVSPYHLIGFAGLQDIERMYSARGVGAPVWQVMDGPLDKPLALSLSSLALLSSEARQMIYGVSEVS